VAWAAAGLYAFVRLAEPATTGPALRVGVVQASVPQEQRFQPGSALRNTLRHLELTRQLLARERLDLVVWSETAVDADLDALPELVAGIAQLVDESGVPLVTGAPRRSGGPLRNSVVLFRPGAGLAEAYDKQRLVPFAEADATALGWLSPLVGRVVAGEPYAAGRESRLLHGPATLATPVCFEITYADLMRRFAAEGAELFVNLSNDAWFGRTGYPAMHLAHAPFRAVEHRRSVVRGTNTGISAVIDPTGRVRSRLGVFEEGALVAEVRPARAPTFYTRHGDVPILSALGVVALGAIAAGRRRPG
jgi:apolipoprotein N-acyltransferase